MRREEPGINWIWYMTDTKEEAEKWYKELTGKDPDEYEICKIRNEYGFRIHR